MQKLSWAEAHAPKNTSDFAGNKDAASRAKKWALEWSRGVRGKPLCLYGPTGIGKSALAGAIANEMGWEVLRFSVYEATNFDKWQKSVASALSGASLFGSQSLVILEDVDCWSQAGFRGSVGAVASLLASSRAPAILTATDWYDRSLVPLRTYAEAVPMKAVNSSDIEKALFSIAKAENFPLSEERVRQTAQSCGGDLRAAINDMQASIISSAREREKSVFEKIRIAIRSPNYRASKSAGTTDLADRDTLKLYILENMPSEFPDVSDRARAFSRFSRADVFDGRIRTRQYWGYLRYSSDLMFWGVASERRHPGAAFVSYGFPSYIQKLGASKSRRTLLKALSKKISARLHTTSLKARDYVPLLVAQNDAPALSAYYGFDEEEVAGLLGTSQTTVAKRSSKK